MERTKDGAAGAGKSQLGRRIYELTESRPQFQGNFVEVNCATIRGDAAMSALFGHVDGSFTGARQDRKSLLMAGDLHGIFPDAPRTQGRDWSRR